MPKGNRKDLKRWLIAFSSILRNRYFQDSVSRKTAFKRNMAEYVTIREFAQGWTFFARKIMYDDFVMVVDGTFPCVDFACSGCDDWLHSDNQNRKVENLKRKFFVHF